MPLSGLSGLRAANAPVLMTPTDLWNLTRIWAESFVRQFEATSPWARSWLDHGLATLPHPMAVSPATWDAAIGQWLRTSYLEFSQQLWTDLELSSGQAVEFWTVSWDLFLQQSGQTVPADSASGMQQALQEVAGGHPRDMRVVYALRDGIGKLCEAAGIEVRGPAWAFSPVAWTVPEEDPLWDLPLQVFGHVLGRPVTGGEIQRHLEAESHWSALATLTKQVRSATTSFYFWFPVANYPAQSVGRQVVNERASVVAVDEETARLLTTASGVQGLPPVKSRHLFVVVAVSAPSLEDAYTKAKYEPEQILAILRVADPRFRWPLADYYYWTAPDADVRAPSDGSPYVAEWRDAYRLRLPQSVAYVAQVHEWRRSIEARPGELPSAAADALHWQGMAYAQQSRETELIAWWIPLERLGHGGRDAPDVLGKLGGWQWHLSVWNGLGQGDVQRGFYQDQQRMKTLVAHLARVRNSVVHSGHLPEKVDIDYTLHVMKHLAHDLTLVTLQLIERHHIETFAQLSAWLDRAMGFAT